MTSQTSSTRTPSRRTLVKGAAWSVPVIAATAPAALAGASCIPVFTAAPTSVKCCSGPYKTMKVDIIVTDANNCIAGGESICIESVTPPNGTVEKTTMYPAGGCTNEGGTITVFLEGVSNCTVNMVVGYRIAGGPLQFASMKSDNISDSDVCPIVPTPPTP